MWKNVCVCGIIAKNSEHNFFSKEFGHRPTGIKLFVCTHFHTESFKYFINFFARIKTDAISALARVNVQWTVSKPAMKYLKSCV